jgi:hypothetical protein
MRREYRIPAWVISLALGAVGAGLLALDVNDLTFYVAIVLWLPLVYVAALEFDDPWRRAGGRARFAVVLLALVVINMFWAVVGVDWVGRPMGGLWVRSWAVAALLVVTVVGWGLFVFREWRRTPCGRRRGMDVGAHRTAGRQTVVLRRVLRDRARHDAPVGLPSLARRAGSVLPAACARA